MGVKYQSRHAEHTVLSFSLILLAGAASILNLDPEESKIYVGGHPASAKIQSAVKYSSFDGQMENLVIGDTPISLWNFKDAEYTQGAQGRYVPQNAASLYLVFNGCIVILNILLGALQR